MPITKKCKICKKEFTRSPALAGKCCSRKCGYEHRKQKRQSKDHQQNRKARQIIYEPSHPLTGKNGYLSLSRFLLFNKIGPSPHKCNWCKRTIHWIIGKRQTGTNALIVDHVNSNPKNNDIKNIVPSCQSCNTKRSLPDQILKEGELFIVMKNGRRLRAELKTCVVCSFKFKFAISKLSKKDRNNKKIGLYCSMKCLYNRNKT